MLGVVFFSLALVVGQVSMHPSTYTLDDNDGQIYTGIMDGNDGQIYTEIMPFERQNLKYVAAGELYQADILLTEEQWAALRARKAVDNLSQRWTEDADGYPLVPYVFLDDPLECQFPFIYGGQSYSMCTTVDSEGKPWCSTETDDNNNYIKGKWKYCADLDQSMTKESLAHWADHTCIKFEETSNTEQPHIQFFKGEPGACWSYVGMIPSWNGQKLSIGNGCNHFSVIVHEVGHAMGWWHEQSRSDRDDYVKILLENVETDYHGAFGKATDNNYSVPYDYTSSMQYGPYSFSSNGKPTIVTIAPLEQELLGSGDGLSHRDKLLANRMYGCIGKWLENCPELSSDPCLNDGYIQANCTCACPPGTSGSNCETVTGGYYDNVRNPRSEKITEETTLTVKTPISIETFIKWIVPPTCKSVKVEFTSGDMYDNCDFQFLNVKTSPTDYTGERICASDVSGGKIITSETGIIITMTNRVSGYTSEMTLWEAVVTFEDIAGCSGPTTTQPPTTTTTPTIPPTTTTIPPTTTEAPPPKLECSKKPSKKILSRGDAFTLTSPGYPEPYSKNKIKCGWKLKAKGPAKLEVTCHTFQLYGKDVLKVNKKFFKSDTGPASLTSKKLGITFISKKRATGPGFTCTVTAI